MGTGAHHASATPTSLSPFPSMRRHPCQTCATTLPKHAPPPVPSTQTPLLDKSTATRTYHPPTRAMSNPSACRSSQHSPCRCTSRTQWRHRPEAAAGSPPPTHPTGRPTRQPVRQRPMPTQPPLQTQGVGRTRRTPPRQTRGGSQRGKRTHSSIGDRKGTGMGARWMP